MSLKKSVILGDHTVAIMRACTRHDIDGPAWSNLVNRAIVVGDYLFRESLPDLTPAEWQTILNVYAGTVGSIEHPPYRIASDMMDDLGLIDVDQHPDADLVRRIHGMSQCQQYAILSFVERFWGNDWNHVENFQDVITAIKSADRPE